MFSHRKLHKNTEYGYRLTDTDTDTEYRVVRVPNGPFPRTEYRYRPYQKNTERQLW